MHEFKKISFIEEKAGNDTANFSPLYICFSKSEILILPVVSITSMFSEEVFI